MSAENRVRTGDLEPTWCGRCCALVCCGSCGATLGNAALEDTAARIEELEAEVAFSDSDAEHWAEKHAAAAARIEELEAETDDLHANLIRVMRERNARTFAIQCFRSHAVKNGDNGTASIIAEYLTAAGVPLNPEHWRIATADRSPGESCETCGGLGYVVVGQTVDWPYGEQNQCPACIGREGNP